MSRFVKFWLEVLVIILSIAVGQSMTELIPNHPEGGYGIGVVFWTLATLLIFLWEQFQASQSIQRRCR